MQPDFLPLIEPGSKFAKKNFESQQQSSLDAKKVVVTLNDLDWEDRETVLRLLFSKMNAGEPATSWRDPTGGASTQSESQRSSRQGETGQGLNEAFRESDADYYGEQ